MGKLEHDVPVIPAFAYLGELFSGEDAPYLMHEDDVVLFQPMGGGKHEVGELGRGSHEQIGNDRILHVVLESLLDGEPPGCRHKRVGADDPHSAHPVGLARYIDFQKVGG